METKKTSNKFLPETRAQAVRPVHEDQPDYPSQGMAIRSVATNIGCSGETLRDRARQAERDHGERPGLTTDERARLKEAERENRERHQANDILRKASASFAAAALNRRSRP